MTDVSAVMNIVMTGPGMTTMTTIMMKTIWKWKLPPSEQRKEMGLTTVRGGVMVESVIMTPPWMTISHQCVTPM